MLSAAGTNAITSNAPFSPRVLTIGGVMSVPSAIAASTSAQKTPKTRARRSDATARCRAMTASTSTMSVAAPRRTCTAKASSGLWMTVISAVGRQYSAAPAVMTSARRVELASLLARAAMATPPSPRPANR